MVRDVTVLSKLPRTLTRGGLPIGERDRVRLATELVVGTAMRGGLHQRPPRWTLGVARTLTQGGLPSGECDRGLLRRFPRRTFGVVRDVGGRLGRPPRFPGSVRISCPGNAWTLGSVRGAVVLSGVFSGSVGSGIVTIGVGRDRTFGGSAGVVLGASALAVGDGALSVAAVATVAGSLRYSGGTAGAKTLAFCGGVVATVARRVWVFGGNPDTVVGPGASSVPVGAVRTAGISRDEGTLFLVVFNSSSSA